ncbi:hypothetical protein BVRB_3g068350 [Beta vulgaris subsp. vulgaris]|nr:hypothetical protein BVRB_3g068350 [Beta vulgaris subsp. vulgaris]
MEPDSCPSLSLTHLRLPHPSSVSCRSRAVMQRSISLSSFVLLLVLFFLLCSCSAAAVLLACRRDAVVTVLFFWVVGPP